LYLLLHFWTPDLEGGQTENTCCTESLGKKVKDVHLITVRDWSPKRMLQALQGSEAFGLPLKPVTGTWASWLCHCGSHYHIRCLRFLCILLWQKGF